jgi:hypothetical protein
MQPEPGARAPGRLAAAESGRLRTACTNLEPLEAGLHLLNAK